MERNNCDFACKNVCLFSSHPFRSFLRLLPNQATCFPGSVLSLSLKGVAETLSGLSFSRAR